MKKIIVLLIGIMLVGCTNEDVDLLKTQHDSELELKHQEMIVLQEQHNHEVQLLEEKIHELKEEQEALKSSISKLSIQYDHQKKAYTHYDDVMRTANLFIENAMFEDNMYYPESNYSDFRLDELSYVYYDETLDITLYRMNYSYKSQSPENIIYAGAMRMTEDGWIVPTYPNSHYLIYREDTYLGHFFINDASPGSQVFKEDLERFLANEIIQPIRLDFIHDSMIYSFDMMTNSNLEVQRYDSNYFLIGGEYEGSIEGVFESSFNLYALLPNQKNILLEETFETDLGTIELITIDVDQGTYRAYYAYLKLSDQEGYVVNLTRYDQSLTTKLNLIALLRSMKRRELISYEEIELKDIIISSNDGIDLVLKEGYFTNDEDPWNAMGPKWVGKFELHVQKEDDVIITPLNPLWFSEKLFFFAPEFKLGLRDYNKDGLMDFALSQYAATNIDEYLLLTIQEDGKVIQTPFDVEVVLGPTTRANSPYFELEGNKIVSTFYDNTVGLYLKDYYEWDGAKYVHLKREEQKN